MKIKSFGFNLLELMITLSIIGLLCALCLPVYSDHFIRARRMEAEIQLIKLAGALEKYYLLNNTYENATLDQLHISEIIADHQYQLQIVSTGREDFLIQAIPLDRQAEKDKTCASLSLDNTGNKGISGSGPLTECWQS